MATIDRIITDYLKRHKRLVVPGFGAFIRRDENGEVVFVEFLKRDDNVLLSLISGELGLGHGEAREALDSYVSGMKRRIEQSGRYIIDGLGIMRLTDAGSYDLSYDPQARAAGADPENGPDGKSSGVAAETTGPAMPVPPQTRDASRADSPVPDGSGTEDAVDPNRSGRENPLSNSGDNRKESASEATGNRPFDAPQEPAEDAAFTPVSVWNILDNRDTSPEGSEPDADGCTPSTPKGRPDSAFAPSRQVPREVSARKKSAIHRPAAPGNRPPRREKKTDWIIIVAVIAAIIALVAIIVGATNHSNPNLDIWNDAVGPARDSLQAQP